MAFSPETRLSGAELIAEAKDARVSGRPVEDAKRALVTAICTSGLTDFQMQAPASEHQHFADMLHELEPHFLTFWNACADAADMAGAPCEQSTGLDLFADITWACEERAIDLREQRRRA